MESRWNPRRIALGIGAREGVSATKKAVKMTPRMPYKLLLGRYMPWFHFK